MKKVSFAAKFANMFLCLFHLKQALVRSFSIKFFILFQTIDDKPQYSLNMKYVNKRTKFKITTALQRETIQVCFRLVLFIHSSVSLTPIEFNSLLYSMQEYGIPRLQKIKDFVALIFAKNFSS